MASKQQRILKLITNVTAENMQLTIARLKVIKQERNYYYEQHHKPEIILSSIEEPFICSHFGCAKTLTRQEQLFGNKCIHHQQITPVEYRHKQQ